MSPVNHGRAEISLQGVIIRWTYGNSTTRGDSLMNAAELRQILVRFAPELFRRCKLLARFGGMAGMFRDKPQREMRSRIIGVVLDHFLSGEFGKLPVAGLACFPRNGFERKDSGAPGIRTGRGAQGFYNVQNKGLTLLG